jgi:hypothetical protein
MTNMIRSENFHLYSDRPTIRFFGLPPFDGPSFTMHFSHFLFLTVVSVRAAQLLLKPATEVLENLLLTPEDPSDPSAWDFEWSFTGIRHTNPVVVANEKYLCTFASR